MSYRATRGFIQERKNSSAQLAPDHLCAQIISWSTWSDMKRESPSLQQKQGQQRWLRPLHPQNSLQSWCHYSSDLELDSSTPFFIPFCFYLFTDNVITFISHDSNLVTWTLSLSMTCLSRVIGTNHHWLHVVVLNHISHIMYNLPLPANALLFNIVILYYY